MILREPVEYELSNIRGNTSVFACSCAIVYIKRNEKPLQTQPSFATKVTTSPAIGRGHVPF